LGLWQKQPLKTQNHQDVIHILIADLERVRLDSVAFKSESFIQALCGKVCGSNQRDLLQSVESTCPADNFFHQCAADAPSAGSGSNVDAPNVAFMVLFVVRATKKTSCAGQFVILKNSPNEVTCRIILPQLLSGCFDSGLQVLFCRIGKGSRIVAQASRRRCQKASASSTVRRRRIMCFYHLPNSKSPPLETSV
jgi:hypothetical protein